MFKKLLFSVLIALVLGAPPPNSKVNRKTNNYKIDGGTPANIADFPWQVYINIKFDHLTVQHEGFLVARDWVVTTAETAILGTGVVSIRVGSNFTDRGGEVYGISKYVAHPDWSLSEGDNNIGLFKLSTPVNTSYASSGRLPEAGESIPDNATLLVTGFNLTYNKPGTLLQQTMPTFDFNTCKAIYDQHINEPKISVNMFCAGINGGRNCYGNKGGPVLLDGKIVGILAENECTSEGFPTVLTRVSNYIGWINENIRA